MNPNAWNENEGIKSVNNNVADPRNETPIVNALSTRADTPGDNYLVAVGSRTARFRRKKKQKFFIVFLILIPIILLVVIVSRYSSSHKIKICETPQCVRSASNLLSSMDLSADPCDDFYQYACGNWHMNHPKPDSSSSYDWFSDKVKSVQRRTRDILATNTSKKDPLPFNQAKEMYSSCIDTNALDEVGLQPILDFLKAVDLPFLPNFLNVTQNENTPLPRYTNSTKKNFAISSSEFDWWKSTAKIKKKTGVDILIGFEIYADPRNNSVRRLMIGEPSDEEFHRHYSDADKILKKVRNRIKKRSDKSSKGDSDDQEDTEKSDEDEEERRELFKVFFINVFNEFLKEMDQSSLVEMPQKQIELNINKTMEVFTKLSKKVYEITEDIENSTNPTNSADLPLEVFDYSVDQLQNATDEMFLKEKVERTMIWKPFLQKMFEGTNVTLDFKKDLLLLTPYDLEYLLKMTLLIHKTPPIILELYLWIQVVNTFIPYTISPIRLVYEQYSQTLAGVEVSTPKSMKCAGTVNDMMGFAVAYGFIDQQFFKNTLPKVEKMLNNIKLSFEDLIGAVSWMDLSTKSVSIEKVRNMKSLIGFPNWLLDRQKLEERYKGITIHPGKYIENILSVKEHAITTKLNSYRQPFQFGWDTEPTDVNAYHVFQANAITIPLVMLEYPFYDLGIEALNYGSIGTILGHELTHGFDSNGRQFDKNGRLIPWWTNSTIESFINKTTCLAKQYSSFYINQIEKYVDGNKTLGENIADNGGLRSTLRAYWREPKEKLALPGLGHLSNEQMFFLSYGNLWCGTNTKKSLSYDIKDEHAPSPARLKGTLQNMPEFANAWKCRANSTMNPGKQRCIVF